MKNSIMAKQAKALFLSITCALLLPLQTYANELALNVYKSPTCGCCSKWLTHLENNGISAKGLNSNNMAAIKQMYGIKPTVQSCHTGVSADEKYIFEGHVPAKSIKRFLSEAAQGKHKDAIGLSVPAMPVGSPGMEVDNRIQPYDVLLLKLDGSSNVFEHIRTLQP